jgi:hypothetical protein
MSYLYSPNTDVVNVVQVTNDGTPLTTYIINNGQPVSETNQLPVTLGSNTITITGNVNVSSVVSVNNFPTTQNVSFSNQSVNLVGNVAGITANVTAYVNNFPTSFNVGNIPATQNVSFNNQAVTLTGNVSGITANVVVSVNNFPTSFNVGNIPATQNVQVLSNTTNYVYTQAAPTWSVDALSKLRTSTTLNQDYYSPVVDDDTSFRWSQALSGTGANSSFLANTSEIQMTSGTSAGGYSYRQTYTKYKIIPGTSHSLYTTVNFEANNSDSGVTRRTGLFDVNNGMFWEQTANTLAVVVRRQQANGTITEDRVYANNFNTDKLDGTGPSGFNIFSAGLNKYYTFWFDFIGGRTGRIRFGIGSPIGPQICHTQSYTGTLTTSFVNDNSLPLRREIYNNTSQSVAPVFNMTGISYQSEAPVSFNPSPATAYNINGFVPGSSLTPMLTIGLRAGNPWVGSDIRPNEFTIVDQNNQGRNSNPGTFFYQVIYNANVNSTYAYNGNNAVSQSNVGRSSQFWTWANTATVTGGLVILSGLTTSASALKIFDGIPVTYNLGSDINGNPATLTIAVQQITAGSSTANLASTFNFIEQL